MKPLLSTEIPDWVNPKSFELDNYSNDNPIDFFLEIDVYHSDELHDLHNHYSLRAEKINVTEGTLSKY